MRAVRRRQITNMSPTSELIALARTAAAKHALDFSFSVGSDTYPAAALVCAIVEQESAWDAHAIRYEPAFRTRYVAPLALPPTEEIARSMSWGLMQVMGQVAREHGFAGKFLSALCEPAAGLDIGCAVFASKLAAALGGRSFSSDISSRAESGSSLPQAVAKGEGPKQQMFEPSPAQGTAVAENAIAHALDESTIVRALQLWNGGANPDYAAQVLARLPK
jgi:Transglycosylase SLT domain